MPITNDLSYYNVLTPGQWDTLRKVVDGQVIRLGFGLTFDSMADNHIEQCIRLGLPYAGYWWVDPTRPVDAQAAMLVRAINQFNPHSIFLDFEQYWTDWAAYMRQDLTQAYASRFSPQQLDDYYRSFWRKVTSTVTIPVGIYSADWFISQYSPGLSRWITTENYWEARYFRYYDKTWWADKQVELGKPFDIENMRDIGAYARIYKGIGRQFESLVPVVGIPHHLDWNTWTPDGFLKMFGVEVDHPEPPEPIGQIYTVTTPAWVRETPNGKIVGYRLKGASILVLDIASGWAKMESGWMGLSVLSAAGSSFRVTAAFLWVRETPDGIKIGWKKYGDIVTVIKSENGWSLIDGGGWVGTAYLEAV
jgi:hypothetical protein